jgi:hypothetical protein
VLKTQFGVNLSVPKMYFFSVFSTEKLKERQPYRYIKLESFFYRNRSFSVLSDNLLKKNAKILNGKVCAVSKS